MLTDDDAKRFRARAIHAAYEWGFGEIAEDLAQEVLLHFAEGRGRHQTVDQALIDRVRARFGRTGEPGHAAKYSLETAELADDVERPTTIISAPRKPEGLGIDIARVIGGCSHPKRREVLRQSFILERSDTEIAARLGISACYVSMLKKAGLEEIRKKLERGALDLGEEEGIETRVCWCGCEETFRVHVTSDRHFVEGHVLKSEGETMGAEAAAVYRKCARFDCNEIPPAGQKYCSRAHSPFGNLDTREPKGVNALLKRAGEPQTTAKPFNASAAPEVKPRPWRGDSLAPPAAAEPVELEASEPEGDATPAPAEAERQIVGTSEIARIFGVSNQSPLNWVKQGWFPVESGEGRPKFDVEKCRAAHVVRFAAGKYPRRKRFYAAAPAAEPAADEGGAEQSRAEQSRAELVPASLPEESPPALPAAAPAVTMDKPIAGLGEASIDQSQEVAKAFAAAAKAAVKAYGSVVLGWINEARDNDEPEFELLLLRRYAEIQPELPRSLQRLASPGEKS